MFKFISIIIMWLMIFGVCINYFAILHPSKTNHIIKVFIFSFYATIIAWLFFGYSFAFYQNLDYSILNINNLNDETIIDMLFHLSFAIYAVVMLIGSVVERISIKNAFIISFLWTILVYSFIVYLCWDDKGYFYQLNLIDFAGGIVVHLSAGVSSLILAKFIKPTQKLENQIKIRWLFLAVVLIAFGWFGFNAGSVNELNTLSSTIILNTFLAIVSGSLAYFIANKTLNNNQDSEIYLLNGIIIGLVCSTASVGYVSPIQIITIVFTSSFLTYFISNKIISKLDLNDSVDSFAMNAIGGFFGSITLVLFSENIFSQLKIQLFAITVCILLSVVATTILIKIFKNN